MLRSVLKNLDVNVLFGTAFFVYASCVFANNITLFGQPSGEPIAAALASKVSDSHYETRLVGIANVDVLNVVPSVSLVLVGVGYYATTTAIGERLETTVGSAITLIGMVVLGISLVWRYRQTVIDRLSAIIAPRSRRLGIACFDAETLEANLTARLRRFFENTEHLGLNQWRLAAVVGLSLVGWLFQTAVLTAAFTALDYSVSSYALLFVIPLANLAGAAPFPGGLGGIEAGFVALLVPTVGIQHRLLPLPFSSSAARYTGY